MADWESWYVMANQGQPETLARIDEHPPVDERRMAYVTSVGLKIAAAMRSDPKMYQEVAAITAGISRATYYKWLDASGPEYEAFQAIVIPAVHEQAQLAEDKAEQDIACCENGSGAWTNWHKWKLEKRYRKIYGDLAQAPTKLALTDSEGNDLKNVPVSQLIALLAKAEGDGT